MQSPTVLVTTGDDGSEQVYSNLNTYALKKQLSSFEGWPFR